VLSKAVLADYVGASSDEWPWWCVLSVSVVVLGEVWAETDPAWVFVAAVSYGQLSKDNGIEWLTGHMRGALEMSPWVRKANKQNSTKYRSEFKFFAQTEGCVNELKLLTAKSIL
jgi:hypothetical protein